MTINRLNQGTTNQVLVKAISGQTTNLLELQDSSGSVVSSIGPTGALGGSLVPPVSGLIHINTTAFSAVASQSINDVFSATYDNYRIVLKVTSSAGSDIRLRWRVGGSDNSTASSYFTQRSQFDGTTFNGARTNDTFALFGISDAGLVSSISADIQSPFLTEQTLFTNLTARTGGNTITWVLSGHHNQSTSYDGFSFFPTSGTITGQISVFGYRK